MKRLLILCFLPLACVIDNEGERLTGPSSIRLTLTDGDTGSAEDRIPFTVDGVPFTFDLEALDAQGERDTSFEGFVRVEAEPGDVVITSSPEGSFSSNILLTAGVAQEVAGVVARAYGETYLWVEDVGFSPAPPERAACSNREDDDADGLFDFPADPGCFYANDDTEQSGGFATGLSETLHFANPSLADIQGNASQSPLSGAAVTVNVGQGPDVVVTRLTSNGMYLSDLEALDTGGHIFAFNYSTPEQTRVCDRIVRLGGIVSEFLGFTELNFPSWQLIPWEGEAGDGTCPVPEPVLLTDELYDQFEVMELYESSLVRAEDLVIAPFAGCDVSGDPDVTDRSGCDPKCACANLDAVAACPLLAQYCEFDQWTANLSGGDGGAIFVVSANTVPNFDPTAHQGEHIAVMTGTLRQIQFIDPPWIVEPRCPADLVIDGEPAPMDEACVTSRTEDPDEN